MVLEDISFFLCPQPTCHGFTLVYQHEHQAERNAKSTYGKRHSVARERGDSGVVSLTDAGF
jgi:hypothetical protein